jgi:hypothetical protein
MSALGQKQTLQSVKPMSALPPKADIGTQPRNARFVPSKLMSGAGGAIAALALGPTAWQATWKKQKQISAWGPAQNKHEPTGYTPNSDSNSERHHGNSGLRPSSCCSANPAGIGAQHASLRSLFGSNRDRKIAASIGSLKQYRTYAAHSSSTYMSNLPAYESKKLTISLSSVSCRRGSTTWYGHSASSFCSQALRLSGSMVNLLNDSEIDCSLSVLFRSSARKTRTANMVNTALKRDQLTDISLSSTHVRFVPKAVGKLLELCGHLETQSFSGLQIDDYFYTYFGDVRTCDELLASLANGRTTAQL